MKVKSQKSPPKADPPQAEKVKTAFLRQGFGGRASKNLKARIYYLIICFVSLVFLINLAGCAELRRKFTKKRITKKTSPHYYSIEKYDVPPSIELYTTHYVYWRSWHREMIELLGENVKKDKRCLREMIGNLEDMKSMLVDEKGDKLDNHISTLRKIEKDINKGPLTLAQKTWIQRKLDKEFKLIKINFSYKKMEPFIRDEFRREDVKD